MAGRRVHPSPHGQEVLIPGKTLADKLLIKPDTTVWCSHREHLGLLAPLPTGVRTVTKPEDAATALVFVSDAKGVMSAFDRRAQALKAAGVLWVAYPKANRADINRDSLYRILEAYGLRPIGQVALDDIWSAMRFRPLKPGEAPMSRGAGR